MLILSIAPSSATTDTVKIAVGEWPPYFSENAEGYGTYAQVVTRAFELEGITVEYGFFPWKRALLQTQSGLWDASAGWGKTSEREPFFHFCDAVLAERELFFYAMDRPVEAQSLQDLSGLSLGIIDGAAMGEELEELVSSGQITVFHQSTLADLFKMLDVGRVDVVMGNEKVAADALASAFSGEETTRFKPLENVTVLWDYRVIVSKKIENGKELCTRFNRGLRKLQDSGEYDRLLWPDTKEDGQSNASPS
ncbi:transporter substrate-binding domain-containing protein [Roseibium sp. FZY0029]|uniref:substrate-binding periplasmic protein n=1 Tax=Roseibium sp. FZY0029 TaxID=3116647 RepID=UPI002E9F3A1A|nr:transporter substrate-binding domain-containing protein [Roseibium sp. FZY0029]